MPRLAPSPGYPIAASDQLRLDKAIKAVQAKLKGEEVSVQVGKPAHDASRS